MRGLMFYSTNLAILGIPGGWEFLVIALIALLLFGSRLPKVAKGLGRSIVEFKKGIKGVGDEIDAASEHSSSPDQSTIDSGKSEEAESEDAGAPPPPDGGSPHRGKGDLSNPGETESS